MAHKVVNKALLFNFCFFNRLINIKSLYLFFNILITRKVTDFDHAVPLEKVVQ